MIRAVLFDWGDTVMRVFPEYSGPMADWPNVEEMPGVTQALAETALDYRLILVTNASDSDAALVRSALRRVGLEKFFADVFTGKELGARKPDPIFYHTVLRECGYSAGEAVMVGDDYGADVVGAKQAGLRAIWYNPAGLSCPANHPTHDGEIQMMTKLPTALGKLAAHALDGS